MLIDHSSISSKQARDADADADAAPAQTATGSWQGLTVRVAPNAADALADAAEEISFEHSERVESRKLEEREPEERPEPILPRVEAIAEYLRSTGYEAADDKLKAFVEALRGNAAKNGGTSAGVREQARQWFGDPTGQFAALSFAAQALARDAGAETLRDEIRDALAELDGDFGGQIRADLNTIQAAAEFGGGNGERVARFQGTYRDAVLGHGTLAAMLKATLEQFGAHDYRKAVNLLIRALGQDLAAVQGPCAPPARLNAVLRDLHTMKVLATLLDGCVGLASRMRDEHGKPSVTPETLVQDLANASTERWNNAGRFQAIADKYGMQEPTSRVAFLSGTRHLLRELPTAIFPEPDMRFLVLKAAQEALDDAIEREEDDIP